MKIKLICGLLLGLTICGSSFASVEKRRAFCEQTDGFVWVEKTKACIPENPCKSDDMNIKNAYCVDQSVPPTDSLSVFEMYIKNALHTEVKDSKLFAEVGAYNSLKDFDNVYMAYYTTDGNYIVFKENYANDLRSNEHPVLWSRWTACWAMGGKFGGSAIERRINENDYDCYILNNKANEKFCSELANLTTDTIHQQVNVNRDISNVVCSVDGYGDSYCRIKCE